MYFIVDIKDKKYVYFPYTLTYFPYSEQLIKILDDDEMAQNIEKIKMLLQREEAQKKAIEKYLETEGKDEHKIGGCEINIFHGCNLRCRYCFAEGGSHGKQGKMSEEIARKTVDFIINHASSDKIKAVIVGGEPFLNKDILNKIVLYGKKRAKDYNKEMNFLTISNATNIDEETSRFLKDENVPVSISLDSHIKEVSDFLRPAQNKISAYEYIVNHLEFFEGASGIQVNVTITPYNLNIFEIAKFLYDELGVTGIHFEMVVSEQEDMLFTDGMVNKLIEEYDQLVELLIEKYKKKQFVRCYPLVAFLEKIYMHRPTLRPCSTLKNRCAFAPNGDIYPCDMMMYDAYRIGNIETGFDYNKIQALYEVNHDDSNCQGCWARYLCGGECIATKMRDNLEQRALRCKLNRHICALKLYMVDTLMHEMSDWKMVMGGETYGHE